jgi:hypothetical protein
LFIRKRQKFPRAKLTIELSYRVINRDKNLLSAFVTISNVGEVLLELDSGFAGLQQIIPVHEHLLASINKSEELIKDGKFEASWPPIKEYTLNFHQSGREIEPSEDEEFYFEFLLDSNVETVLFYTYFRNQTKKGRELGWNKIKLYDLKTL